MQIPDLIADTETLAAFCQTLKGEAFITVDTEFMRERTYFPQLCLLQVASSKEAVAIDPLAEGIDLAPIFDVMRDASIRKVFHAARQDLEIFHHLMGEMPSNMYDTQIAAMVCGFGESAGYERLVTDMLGGTLDKASRFTDWAKRPLTPRQIRYALDDVTYLRDIYTKLQTRLAADGRDVWIAEEMAELANPALYAPDPDSAWQKLKVKSRASAFLQVLRAVAAWRERRAVQRDLPRGRVLRDDVVLQIAAEAPETVDAMQEIRGMKGQMSPESMEQLVELILQAKLAPKEDFPTPPPRPQSLGAAGEACLEMLRMLLRQRCDEANVVPRLIADRDELEQLVRGATGDAAPRCMHGWRYEIFGRDAEAWLSGKLRAQAKQTKKGYGVEWTRISETAEKSLAS